MVIPAGETSALAKATCTVPGIVGNNFAVGELNHIVDPQPFLQNMTNVTVSEGGSDIEDDDSLRERIHEAPESYSCAGSAGSYIYHAKSVSALIGDVAVHSPTPGYVDVYVLLDGGQLPGDEILQAVSDKLNEKTVRPLTDLVTVKAPTVFYYDLSVKYFISRADAVQAAAISEAAESSVQDYVDWQRSHLGRDIVPDELIHRLKAAGVKRVEISSPQFTVLDDFSVAIPSSVQIVFAGLEDD